MSTPIASTQTTAPSGFIKWHHRVLGFCLAIFAFELGLFLVVFPWLSNWDLNWVPIHSHNFSTLWMSRYFRGALSGLGLINVFIAINELIRQVKSIFAQ